MLTEPQPGTKLGNNELLLRIGRGGMATVWVARERVDNSDRIVAVKAMLPHLAGETEFVSMFIDEVRLVRAIHHPNVVEVYDVGKQDGTMWMSMEWVEGESLHTIISEAGKRRAIPPEMAVRILADAAAGLHAAHELRDETGALRGVVHRDVSPHNILIGTQGQVKLVDFGVAKALGRISEATQGGQLKGKFGYMSPEQARGKKVDRRSDVFSLGIVLFELTTNRRLFRGNNDVDTLRLVLAGRVPRPSSIDPSYPPKLEAIVMRALERELSDRYQTADELRRDLEGYLKEERIVVARSGLAGLLKRVMGERIEQRRKAVRRAVKAVDGLAESAAALISGDAAFVGGAHDSASGISTVGDPHGSNPSHSTAGWSGASHVGTPTGATPGSGGHTPLSTGGYSGPGAPDDKPIVIYVLLGVIVLLLVLVVVLLARGL
jgi:serine/threonine-protein kinase